MKKLIAAILLIIVISSLILAGCASPAPAPSSAPPSPKATPASSPAAATITLRYSTALTGTDFVVDAMKILAQEMEKRTNGQVKVQVYANAELYPHNTLPDALTSSAIDMGVNSPTHWSGYTPLVEYGTMFFAVPNPDQWKKSKDGIAAVLDPVFEGYGAKRLNWMAYAGTAIATTFPVTKPDDLKNKKIRGSSAATRANVKTLGGVPVELAENEVYDALSKHGIDGAISGFNSFWTRKYYEVTKYVIGPFLYSRFASYISLKKWNSLPPNIQKTLLEVSQEAEAYTLAQELKVDDDSIKNLKAKGVEVKVLSDADIALWREAMKPAMDAWIKKCTDAGSGDKVQAMAKALTGQ